MPRTAITPVTPLGSYDPYAADAANVVPAAMSGAAGSSGNQFVASGKDLVLMENTGASPYTITFSSVNCDHNRTGDVTTYSLAAGEFAVFGAFNVPGWRQTDNNVYFEATNVAVKAVVVALP